MTDTVTSGFANPTYKLEDYTKNLTSNYVTPALIDYKKPLNLAETNRLNVFGKDNLKSREALGLGASLSNSETPWYKDGDAMQGYAGLASSFAQLASLPGQLELAKLQRKGLKQNIKQQKIDNAFRASARANLNKTM